MSTESIPQRKPGQKTDASWWNLLKSVLSGDFVPRALTGNPSDRTAMLAQSAYRWVDAHLRGALRFGSTNNLGLQASDSSVSDYVLTMPSALPPSGTSPVQIDDLGNISLLTLEDILEASSTQFRVKDSSIVPTKLSSLGTQTGSSTGTGSISSTTFVAITNASVSITTTGRPVKIGFTNDLSLNIQTAGNAGYVRLLRSGSEIARIYNSPYAFPTNQVFHIDMPAAGTYTYTAEYQAISPNSFNFRSSRLFAYELQ
jgi:hypothetical protein